MDALLRSHIQFQGEVASFVFAGSEPGLMRELFEDRGAAPLRAGRADAARAARRRRHRRVRRRAVPRDRTQRRGGAQPVARLGPGAPAADDAARPPPLGAGRARRRTATLADWAPAHAAALEELRPEFDANWRRLSTNEQKALRAVVAGSGSPYRRP